jgi:hypothetical protein
MLLLLAESPAMQIIMKTPGIMPSPGDLAHKLINLHPDHTQLHTSTCKPVAWR